MSKTKQKPIDKVTTDLLDISLRMVGEKVDKNLLDKIIDLVELIEEKGDQTSIRDVVALQTEWNKHYSKFA